MGIIKLQNKLIEVLKNEKYKFRARYLQFSPISSYYHGLSTTIFNQFLKCYKFKI